MKATSIPPIIKKPKRSRKRATVLFVILMGALEVFALLLLVPLSPSQIGPSFYQPPRIQKPGDVVVKDSSVNLTPAETTRIIHRNYPSFTQTKAVGIKKITFRYRSSLSDGTMITVYGRAYLPLDSSKNLPIFAFAPGTTGIGDQCAASLENPDKANWGNYDSHMSAYAAQGYAAVTTDYEGMRDPERLHHYMVGELEGRALIDAVRALRHLSEARGRLSPSTVFLAGYSQGGHAAFWADKIAASYATDVKPTGVIGYGPVMSVKQTLTDVTRGANINWFGPHIVVSYQDYYHTRYPNVILPNRETSLSADVLSHCIDSDLPYWGHTPIGIYTSDFISSALSGDLSTGYGDLDKDLEANEVGEVKTTSSKRINEGARDNVVLPSQQTLAAATLCRSSIGPVQYVIYPNSTHYDTMSHSFVDTLSWMRAVLSSERVASTCN